MRAICPAVWSRYDLDPNSEQCATLPSVVDVISFLLLLIVAGLCGSLGQAIAGSSHGGCLGSIAVGFIGALLGLALARWLVLPEIFTVNVGNVRFPVIWSVAGSALFVGVLALFTRRRLGP